MGNVFVDFNSHDFDLDQVILYNIILCKYIVFDIYYLVLVVFDGICVHTNGNNFSRIHDLSALCTAHNGVYCE